MYTPSAGTVLGAGAGQLLSASFTPTDTADYQSVAATTTINVLKATPTIDWASPVGIVYGTPPGSNQLDATASTPGSSSYSLGVGTVLGAGHRTLSASFTPTDSIDYNPVIAITAIDVAKAHLTVIAANKDMGHGDPVPALSYTLNGFVNGDNTQAVGGSAALSTTATSASAAGAYPITAAIGSLSAANHDFAFVLGKLRVNPKVLDVRVHWGTKTLSLIGLTCDIPFIDITLIDVVFSDDVPAAKGDLALASTVGSKRAYSFSGFSDNAAGHDATWILPTALGIDRLMRTLDDEFGAKVDPTISVWNKKPVAFAVLPGDFNGDGFVDNSDVQAVKKLEGTTSLWADVDGNGLVNNSDLNTIRRRTGTHLP